MFADQTRSLRPRKVREWMYRAIERRACLGESYLIPAHIREAREMLSLITDDMGDSGTYSQLVNNHINIRQNEHQLTWCKPYINNCLNDLRRYRSWKL